MGDERLEGFICDECVEKRKLVTRYPTGGNTITRGLCGYCDRKDEVFLTPIVDFKGHGKGWD